MIHGEMFLYVEMYGINKAWTCGFVHLRYGPNPQFTEKHSKDWSTHCVSPGLCEVCYACCALLRIQAPWTIHHASENVKCFEWYFDGLWCSLRFFVLLPDIVEEMTWKSRVEFWWKQGVLSSCWCFPYHGASSCVALSVDEWPTARQKDNQWHVWNRHLAQNVRFVFNVLFPQGI